MLYGCTTIVTFRVYSRPYAIEETKDIECGTVHKFQGKQAEEVFFVLGCSEKSKSAVRWVNSNIVNVAVTRAMIRLYVVGDYDLWTKENSRNFELVGEKLKKITVSEIINLEKMDLRKIIKFFNINFSQKIITDKYNRKYKNACCTDEFVEWYIKHEAEFNDKNKNFDGKAIYKINENPDNAKWWIKEFFY